MHRCREASRDRAICAIATKHGELSWLVEAAITAVQFAFLPNSSLKPDAFLHCNVLTQESGPISEPNR
jgi:hypothetical protein